MIPTIAFAEYVAGYRIGADFAPEFLYERVTARLGEAADDSSRRD